MLSIFLCYAATAFCLLSSKGRFASLFLPLIAGGSSALGVWNGPLFIGLSLVPVFVAAHLYGRTERFWKCLLLFALGALITFVVLLAVVVLRDLEAWKEQFPRNALYYSTAAMEHHHEPLLRLVLERLTDLRSRLSALGRPYALWYIAMILWIAWVFRLSATGFAAAIWMCVFLVLVELNTPTMFFTMVQFAAAFPLLLLMAAPNRRLENRLRNHFVWSIGALCCLLHPWLMFRSTAQTRAYDVREQTVSQLLNEFKDSKQVILGPIEAAFPTWNYGFRYLAPSPVYFQSDRDVLLGYSELARKQATITISNDLSIQLLR